MQIAVEALETMNETPLLFLLISLLVAYGIGRANVKGIENKLLNIIPGTGTTGSELPDLGAHSFYLVLSGLTKGIIAIFFFNLPELNENWSILVTASSILGNAKILTSSDRQFQGPFIFLGALWMLHPIEMSPLMIIFFTLYLTFGNVPLSLIILLAPLETFLLLLKDSMEIPLLSGFVLLFLWTLIPCRPLVAEQCFSMSSSFQSWMVRRKVYRYAGLVFPFILYPLLGEKGLTLILGIGAGILWSLEVIRKFHSPTQSMIFRIMGPVAKTGENENITGTSKYFLGCFLASLFPAPLNVLSMIMMTLGDAWAILVGKRLPLGQWMKGKSLTGTMASLASCFWAASIYLQWAPSDELDLWIVFGGSLAAAIAEGLSGPWDNLFMAPAAAITMYFLL